MTSCRCGAEILLALTESGAVVPVDAVPVQAIEDAHGSISGYLRRAGGPWPRVKGRPLKEGEPLENQSVLELHRSHRSACPAGGEGGRGGR